MVFEKIVDVIENFVSKYELDILVKEDLDSPAVPLFKKAYTGEVGVYEETYKVILLVDDNELDIMFVDFTAMNVVMEVVDVFECEFEYVDVKFTKAFYIDECLNCVSLNFKY